MLGHMPDRYPPAVLAVLFVAPSTWVAITGEELETTRLSTSNPARLVSARRPYELHRFGPHQNASTPRFAPERDLPQQSRDH